MQVAVVYITSPDALATALPTEKGNRAERRCTDRFSPMSWPGPITLTGMAMINWTNWIFSLWRLNLGPTEKVRQRAEREVGRQAGEPGWTGKLSGKGVGGC